MKNNEKIVFFGKTDIGKQRTNNEDAFAVEQLDENTALAVVIDGVGGYEGGEVASEIAQREIPAYLKEFNRGERLELLKQAVVCANNAIYDRRCFDTARPHMSCVLTSALIDTNRKVIDMVHVGDTRLYQFHHEELQKLSHDHSYVGYCEERGELTEEQAMHHPRRNEISRAVGDGQHGVGDLGFLEAEEFPLLPNSSFLLCSDGLTDLVTSHQIVAILEQPISIEEKVQNLIDAANEAGGKDNITVVLVEYQAEEAVNQISENDDLQIEEKNEAVLPDMSETKKWKVNVMVSILIVISLILLGVCVALLISSKAKDERMQKLEEQMTQMFLANSTIKPDVYSSMDTLIASASTINPVRSIAIYSKAVEENDFDAISQLFASHVRRYIDSDSLSNSEVINMHRNYDEKYGVLGKHVNVRWETWEELQLADGEVSVNYVEDYNIDRKDTTKKSKFVLKYYVTFDKDGKIVSIYYDELPKSR